MAQSFWLLLGQKLMGTYMTKVMINWEIPSLTDSTFIFFVCLHFTTFVSLHSSTGSTLLTTYSSNKYRKLVQETFKGLGKGKKLLSLISKGVEMNFSLSYFVLILIVRGTASSIYKSVILSLLLKKNLKFKKTKANFLFISFPSILTFTASKWLFNNQRVLLSF